MIKTAIPIMSSSELYTRIKHFVIKNFEFEFFLIENLYEKNAYSES